MSCLLQDVDALLTAFVVLTLDLHLNHARARRVKTTSETLNLVKHPFHARDY